MLISDKPHSSRTLTVFSLTMINVIAIDSLRNLPTAAAMGLTIPFFYLLASLLFLLPCIHLTALFSRHRSQTGGVYVWVSEAFGPKWGFFLIWLQWIYNVFWYPTILSFIAASIAYLINPALANQKIFMVPLIIGMFTLATLANGFGMKLSSWMSSVGAIIGTIIPMCAIIILGLIWIIHGNPLAITPNLQHFIPNLKHVPNLAFLVVVFFSLMGIEMSAVHAGEVKDPERNYPRALYYSAIIIVSSLTLASTAIAIVVPQNQLNIVSGLNQAFTIFLDTLHLSLLLPVVLLAVILGSFGNMAAWVIGPTKGLMVAGEENIAPRIFGYKNRYGAPIAVLGVQWVLVLLLCGLFLWIPSFSTSYWILSDLTAQMALIFYVLFFAAGIKHRYQLTQQPRKLCFSASIGLITCLGALIIGFIPPKDIVIHHILRYELMLILGLIVFILPPWIISGIKSHQRFPTV